MEVTIKIPDLTPKQKIRFLRKIQHNNYDFQACWLWPKKSTVIKVGNAMTRSSRVAYLLWYGKDPYPLHVLHHCDNPRCVNPLHLFLGTHADNMRDMKEKGRASRKKVNQGSSHGLHKLTEAQVKNIRFRRSKGASQRSLAAKYKIDPSTISDICNRKSWTHI